jgi:hypothetical protein
MHPSGLQREAIGCFEKPSSHLHLAFFDLSSSHLHACVCAYAYRRVFAETRSLGLIHVV